jgi:hypothetical protein
MKNRNAQSYISWMLFDLVEGILVIGFSFLVGLALRGALS